MKSMGKKQEQGSVVGDEIVSSSNHNNGLTAHLNTFAAIAIIALFSTLPTPLPIATASDATPLVTAAARRHNVPVDFALRIAHAESRIQCGVHNRRSSASGPLQVIRRTARAMGYRGDIRTASCAMQTEYGMRALAFCYRAARGNQPLAKRCHQQGISAVYGRRRR